MPGALDLKQSYETFEKTAQNLWVKHFTEEKDKVTTQGDAKSAFKTNFKDGFKFKPDNDSGLYKEYKDLIGLRRSSGNKVTRNKQIELDDCEYIHNISTFKTWFNNKTQNITLTNKKEQEKLEQWKKAVLAEYEKLHARQLQYIVKNHDEIRQRFAQAIVRPYLAHSNSGDPTLKLSNKPDDFEMKSGRFRSKGGSVLDIVYNEKTGVLTISNFNIMEPHARKLLAEILRANNLELTQLEIGGKSSTYNLYGASVHGDPVLREPAIELYMDLKTGGFEFERSIGNRFFGDKFRGNGIEEFLSKDCTQLTPKERDDLKKLLKNDLKAMTTINRVAQEGLRPEVFGGLTLSNEEQMKVDNHIAIYKLAIEAKKELDKDVRRSEDMSSVKPIFKSPTL